MTTPEHGLQLGVVDPRQGVREDDAVRMLELPKDGRLE